MPDILRLSRWAARDSNALLRHWDAVAAMADANRGNAVNAKLPDALVRHFERDYAYASSHIE